MTRFDRILVGRDDVIRGGSAKNAVRDAIEAKRRQLARDGIDPDTVEAVHAWNGADGLAVSIKYIDPPTRMEGVPEWVPTALDRMRGAA